jgi:hypothetical protein
LLLAFEEEFTYAFGGCTIVKSLAGSYLSHAGVTVSDRINLISPTFPSLYRPISRSQLAILVN